MRNTPEKRKPADVRLKCSPSTLEAIRDYSTKTGIPMNRIIDDMAADWLSTVGKARLEALSQISPARIYSK